MSSPFERNFLGLFVPGIPNPSADPEAATVNSSTSVGADVSDGGIDTASVTRRHTEAFTASSGGAEGSTGSTTSEFLGNDQQEPEERTSTVLSATPGSGDATPQVPLGSGSVPVYLLDRPSQSQVVQGASTGSSLLGKRRRSDSPPDSVKRARKPRMKGRKGETEGYIPDWDIDKVYGLTTLVKRIGQTKMKAFLRSQGVDVDSMFPTSRVTYKGKEMTRGEAIAREVQAVQAALIERRKATGLASSTGPSSSSYGRISKVDQETGSEKADNEEELSPEGSGSEEDGEFELEDNAPKTFREAEATWVTRQALKQITEAVLKTLSSEPHTSNITTTSALNTPSSSAPGKPLPQLASFLNPLGQPIISDHAQDLIAMLVLVDDAEEYEVTRSALVEELSSFIRRRFDVDAQNIATQLVEEEF